MSCFSSIVNPKTTAPASSEQHSQQPMSRLFHSFRADTLFWLALPTLRWTCWPLGAVGISNRHQVYLCNSPIPRHLRTSLLRQENRVDIPGSLQRSYHRSE